MTEKLYAGGPDNNIASGNISYSRKGVYDYVFAYGNRTKIETTFIDSEATASFDNVLLVPNWDESVTWNPALAKTQRTKYQDHFRRYSMPGGANQEMAETDVLKVVASNASTPRGYREFESTLVKLSTDTVELSPYADIEVDTTWEQAPFNVSVDNNSNVPSLLFNADIQTKNLTKDMGKAVTVSFWSMGRLYEEGYVTGSNIDTDFHPFIVVTKERFIDEQVRSSLRDTPSGSETNNSGDSDSTELAQYAANQQDTFRRIMSSGGASLVGYADGYRNGVVINEIQVYYEGAYVTKSTDLLITSRRYNFENDTTSIGFSRV